MSQQDKSQPSPDREPTHRPWHLLAFEQQTTTAPSGNQLHWARRACDNTHCDTTIVFFHGVLRNWQSFYPLFGPLNAMAHLVSLDFRGHGQSSSTPNAYRVVDYVADAVHVLGQLPGKLIVYGHSLGAMVALAASARLPAKVHAAILEDPPFATMGKRLPGTALMNYFEAVARCLSQLQADYPERPNHRLGTVPPNRSSRDSGHLQSSTRSERYFEAFSEMVVGQGTDGLPIRIRDQRDEPSRRFTGESLSQLDPHVLQPITAGKWLEHYEVLELASAIRCPVHVLQADPQQGGMLADHDVELLRGPLGTQLRHTYFPGVGHSMHWSQPLEIIQLLRSELTLDNLL